VKPAVHAIRAAIATLDVQRLPGFYRSIPRLDHARKIVGMNQAGGSQVLQLVERLTEVFQLLPICEQKSAGCVHERAEHRELGEDRRDEVETTVRNCGPNRSREGIDDAGELVLHHSPDGPSP
jgi:hypothetical protein